MSIETTCPNCGEEYDMRHDRCPAVALAAGSAFGVLTRAGTFPIRDEETTGFVVSCSPEELQAIERIPMYRRVVVVPVEEYAASAVLGAILDAAHRATEQECTCGGNPADDPQCCPACKVYHRIEAAKRDSQHTGDEQRLRQQEENA